MQLNHFVIHELKKEQNGPASVILSNELPTVNEHSISLVQALNEKYKSRETYGRFDPNQENTFPNKLQTYFQNVENNTFLDFTTTTMNHLNEMVQLVPKATGGYFLFADYGTQYGNFVSIFLVRNTNGFLFKKEQKMFDVKPQTHIEIEKFAMGCKINKGRYLNQEGNYLSFIRTDRQDTSKYFVSWISATALRQNSEYTDNLCTIINEIEMPAELDDQIPTRDFFKKKVYDYCKNTPSGKVNLSELSVHLFGKGNENKIVNFAVERQLALDTEFRPDSNKLKRLYRVNISADGVTLGFDFSKFNNIVKLDPQKKNIIIIESQSLADQIRVETAFGNGN
ncbi:MAG: nucleoid-associated protein [Bacteroidetes bacterium]|nr:nucleoid-associated protein [Bacteroidota bacterium]